MHTINFVFLVLTSISIVIFKANATCFEPSPAFPPPDYDAKSSILEAAFLSLESTIHALADDDAFNTTSFSIEVTSSKSTLWDYHSTAPVLNSTRPGANPVSNESFYRIASITKVYTTLAIFQQAIAGNLSLDDPVNKYLPDLKGVIPWKDITIRSLASQLSGIPRDWSQGDILPLLPDPSAFGFPVPNNTHLPDCFGYNEQFIPCNASALYYALAQSLPIFPPNQHSAYSNTNFELLGLVISTVSGLSYEDYILTRILAPLNITSSAATFTSPPDNVSVLPSGEAWYHDVNAGIHNPTGGLFMTTAGSSTFIRYVLTHFNSPPALSLATGNWLFPHSFTASIDSYYGTPWEIFRTSSILLPSSRKAVSFFTKGGGQPGYVSKIILAPEYNLGFSIFVGGDSDLLDLLIEEVTVSIIRAAEELATQQMSRRYAGTYLAARDSALNSSLTLSYAASTGLTIDEFISNGTAVLEAFSAKYPKFLKPGSTVQLIPTLLYVDEENQSGEKWRFLVVPSRPGPEVGEQKVWDTHCVTDIDFLMYDGRPMNELVFWRGDGDGDIESVDLTAFRVRLEKVEHKVMEEELVRQEL